jgi:glutathione peroxidase
MNVSFEPFAKISVKGDDQAPLYRFLTNYPDENIKGPVVWNFQKYLVGRDGTVLAKWGPRTLPEDEKILTAIEKALASK